MILHTDQGVQFRSYAYWKWAENHEVVLSMTDGYASWQNAIVETFFKSIKRDYFWKNTYLDAEKFNWKNEFRNMKLYKYSNSYKNKNHTGTVFPMW